MHFFVEPNTNTNRHLVSPHSPLRRPSLITFSEEAQALFSLVLTLACVWLVCACVCVCRKNMSFSHRLLPLLIPSFSGLEKERNFSFFLLSFVNMHFFLLFILIEVNLGTRFESMCVIFFIFCCVIFSDLHNAEGVDEV